MSEEISLSPANQFDRLGKAQSVLFERITLSIRTRIGEVTLAVVAHNVHFLLVELDGFTGIQGHI
jgi:hypothetical protein